MTARMDALNMLYRDFKVADDVSKMKALGRFDVEYTVYGSRFQEAGKAHYIISTQKSKIVAYISQRAHFEQWPLPVESYTLMSAVPAGYEEDILRLAKVKLARKLQEGYDEEFLAGFYALAALENDDAGESLLTDLQEKVAGRFCRENLMLFEGLLSKVYQAKHVKKDTLSQYERWLAEEYRQLEDEPRPTEQYEKKLYGLAFEKGTAISVYCNAQRAKAYEKQEQLMQEGVLTSAVCVQNYGYRFDKTIGELRKQFEAYLRQVFDPTYFDYLRRIAALGPGVPTDAFRQWQAKNETKGEMSAKAINCYEAYWQIR